MTLGPQTSSVNSSWLKCVVSIAVSVRREGREGGKGEVCVPIVGVWDEEGWMAGWMEGIG